MSIDAIIVLYNTDVKNIHALSMLQSANEVNKIIICDNSTVTNENSFKCKQWNKIKYNKMAGNIGLSKAYNIAIKEASSKYVLMLDDDTELPEDFFQRVKQHMDEINADVYIPLVKSKKILMSPCKKGKYRFSAFRTPNEITKPYSAINSGLIVRRKVFESIRYPENLFLDMIDHAFFDELRRFDAKCCVMHDVVLTQDYSRETDNKQASRFRFKITKKDNKEYYKKNFMSRLFCNIQLMYWKFKLIVKFKDLRILFW